MNIKSLVILVAVLGVAALGLWIGQRSDTRYEPDPVVGEALVPSAALQEASQVWIYKDQAEEPAVTLVRRADQWIIENYYELPIDFSKLRSLIRELSETRIIRAVTANPERMDALNLGQSSLVFADAEGNELARVDFGRQGDTGGVFVLSSISPKALLIDSAPRVETRRVAWADNTPLGLSVDGLTQVTLDYGEAGTVQLERDDAANSYSVVSGLPPGKEINQEKIQQMVDQLLDPRVRAAVPADDTEAAEAMVYSQSYTLTYDDGQEVVLTVGRRPELPRSPEPDAFEGIPDLTEVEMEPAGTPFLSVTGVGPAVDAIVYELTAFNYEQFPVDWSRYLEDAPEKDEG